MSVFPNCHFSALKALRCVRDSSVACEEESAVRVHVANDNKSDEATPMTDISTEKRDVQQPASSAEYRLVSSGYDQRLSVWRLCCSQSSAPRLIQQTVSVLELPDVACLSYTQHGSLFRLFVSGYGLQVVALTS